MSDCVTQSALPPKGGVRRASRAMNLAHFLRQSARRYAGEVGLVYAGD